MAATSSSDATLDAGHIRKLSSNTVGDQTTLRAEEKRKRVEPGKAERKAAFEKRKAELKASGKQRPKATAKTKPWPVKPGSSPSQEARLIWEEAVRAGTNVAAGEGDRSQSSKVFGKRGDLARSVAGSPHASPLADEEAKSEPLRKLRIRTGNGRHSKGEAETSGSDSHPNHLKRRPMKAPEPHNPLKNAMKGQKMEDVQKGQAQLEGSHEEITVNDLELTAIETKLGRVPKLSHGLHRALFQRGVIQLRDLHSRVYNFDPGLEMLPPVDVVDFKSLAQFTPPSKDATLAKIARESGKKYLGSTSSLTGLLKHFHFLLSAFREINFKMLSGLNKSPWTISKITKSPEAVILRYNDGIYSIDADKTFDQPNVLSLMGRYLEKLFTTDRDTFEKYKVGRSHELTEEDGGDDAYHYSTLGDFLMRSQLDAHDPRLPGTGMFDLKTRAVLPIRMDSKDFEWGMDYEIQSREGQFSSFEREFADMARATMLKYSLQVRIGRMDGIFVAYHNIARIFGFQYLSLNEMDYTLHGQEDRTLGDQEFLASMHLLNKLLDKAIEKFPKQSLRIHVEAPDSSDRRLFFFAEPVTDEQINEIQGAQKDNVAAWEAEILKLEEETAEADADSSFVGLSNDSTRFRAKARRIADERAKAILEARHKEDMEISEGDAMAIATGQEPADNARPSAATKVVQEARSTETVEDTDAAVEASTDVATEIVEEVEVGSTEVVEESDAAVEASSDAAVTEIVEDAGSTELVEETNGAVEASSDAATDLVEEGGSNEVVEETNAAEEAASTSSSPILAETTLDQVDAPAEDAAEGSSASAPNQTTAEITSRPAGESESELETDHTLISTSSPTTTSSKTLPPPPSKKTSLEKPPLLALTLTTTSHINGKRVLRPSELSPTDSWTIQHSINEITPPVKAWRAYEALKNRRATLLKGKDPIGSGGLEDETRHVTGSQRDLFRELLRRSVREGRKWRSVRDEEDRLLEFAESREPKGGVFVWDSEDVVRREEYKARCPGL